MIHPEVKPTIPKKTQLFNIYYRGNIERRNLPKQDAYRAKSALIATGRYFEIHFEVNPVE